jgi:hypothetical protein
MGIMCKTQVPVRLNSSREIPINHWVTYGYAVEVSMEKHLGIPQNGMGHLEEEIRIQTLKIQREVLEHTIQKKSDLTPPLCPHCQSKLKQLKKIERTVQSAFGPVTFLRLRGYCLKCKKWVCPADHALKIDEHATASPAIQELSALMVSKMPVSEAQAVISRITGQRLSKATLDREAKRQGKRAEDIENNLNKQISKGCIPGELKRKPLDVPFTMVVQIDAWNIRERNDWGISNSLRQKGEEPERWHWVYGAIAYRLEDCQSVGNKERERILHKAVVMTRGGVDTLREKLWAECMRLGIGKAKRILVLGDGAAWIWNLAKDRFQDAEQRVDFYHVSQHLWVVAKDLFSDNKQEAKKWIHTQQKALKKNKVGKVIKKLRELESGMDDAVGKIAGKEANYLESHQERMKYAIPKNGKEPIGSGSIESCCRQYQCRFKRTGQFWSREGDEALLILENSWRNDRWSTLFPHVDASNYGMN